MASPKKDYSKLSRSAKYYRDNPEARGKKAETDKEINSRPEQRSKRSELVKIRRNNGTYGKGGADMSHTSVGVVKKSQKENRGSKKDTDGDKRARGGRG